MLSTRTAQALDEQITKEFGSSYLYLQMPAWFTNQGLPGFASWMKVQALIRAPCRTPAGRK